MSFSGSSLPKDVALGLVTKMLRWAKTSARFGRAIAGGEQQECCLGEIAGCVKLKRVLKNPVQKHTYLSRRRTTTTGDLAGQNAIAASTLARC